MPDQNKTENFEIVKSKLVFQKKPVDEILMDLKSIDTDLIATEVLTWLDVNVENFINNHVKTFKIDLVLDSSESMTEIKKLQDLYRAISDDDPNNEKAIEDGVMCRKKLDKITNKAWKTMMGKKDLLEKLFIRMSYYYEMKGLKDGKPIIQELEGFVDILKLEYEAFSLGVRILQGSDVENEDGLKKGEKKILKEYEIQEGFTVWLELLLRPKQKPVAIF